MPLYFQIARGESAMAGLLLIATGHRRRRWHAALGGLHRALRRRAARRSSASSVMLVRRSRSALTADTPTSSTSVAMILRGFGIGLCMMPAMTAAYRG